MANTTVKKNAKGYGYQYTDIAEIHEWLESQGYTYYQYIETLEGNDYIMTVPIIEGKEKPPRRGCKVITATLSNKSNPAQEQGSGLTYARRYSLLMAFGLATTDDDAQCMTREEAPKSAPSATEEKKTINEAKQKVLEKRCTDKGVSVVTLLDKCKLKSLADVTEKQFVWLSDDKNWKKLMEGK